MLKIHILKKFLSLIIGIPIIIIGIILIPLPGPGLLITLLGLYVLSKGFKSAEIYFEKYKNKIINIYHQAKQKQDDYLKKHDL